MAIYSAVAPLALFLLSSVWRYPAELEEVVKWGILVAGLRGQDRNQKYAVKSGMIVGLVFGLSEAVLFSTNAWTGSQWGAMGTRLVLTVPMHVATGVVIAWFVGKKMGWVGLAVAMLLHGLFNYLLK